jgi:hypothetical protein
MEALNYRLASFCIRARTFFDTETSTFLTNRLIADKDSVSLGLSIAAPHRRLLASQ